MTTKRPPNDPHDDVPIRPTQGTRAGVNALQRAQTFACLVRDEAANGIGDYLDGLTLDQLYGLTTVLAAMVPVDQTPADLLAWLDDLTPAEAVA